MRLLTIVLATLLLASCSSRSEKHSVSRGRMKGYAIVPLPNASGVLVPTKVTVDVTTLDDTVEEGSTHSGLDKEEVAAMIDAGVKAAISAAPGGGALNDVLGLVLGGAGVLAGGGAAVRARSTVAKTGAAMADAVAAARDALAALPPEQADAIKDKHRERQKRRGTNDLIKSQL